MVLISYLYLSEINNNNNNDTEKQKIIQEIKRTLNSEPATVFAILVKKH